MANVNTNTNTTEKFTVRYYTGCSWCSIVTMSRTGLTGKATKFTYEEAVNKCNELISRGLKTRIYSGRLLIEERVELTTEAQPTEEQPTEEQPTEKEMLMLCDEDGNEIYLAVNTTDMCRYIQENHKNINGNVYIAYGTYNTKTKCFEKNDYSEYVDFIEMYSANFSISIHEILGTDDTIVNSYSGTEEITEEIKHAVEEAKKAGVCYPYDENTDCKDCKDCMNLHDCSFRGELAHDEKCELKQPVEMYVDTEIPLLLNIKSILETLFERVEKFKASYTWGGDNGNSSLRESKSKYYSMPKQSFTVFGDVYTLEFTVEYKRTSVYKYTYYTKNETRITLRTLKTLYKKICNELKRKGIHKDDM